jgi:hypothetical protein
MRTKPKTEENNYKILSDTDIYNMFGTSNYQPILSIDKEFDHKLKTNLMVASTFNAYSCCIEYIRNWIFSKFPEGFFRSEHLDYSHILTYMKKFDMKGLVESTPCINITPEIEFNFNRENIDLYNMGLNFYHNRCSYKDAFFIDNEKSLFISCNMEVILMRFNIKIVVQYRGIQLDVGKFCQIAFRANGTQKHRLDIDYPVPTELIEQLAEDAGYTLDINNIESLVSFNRYLNSNSRMPFIYKLDLSSGKIKWYMKMTNVLVHIRTEDINLDQGNRFAQTHMDYNIEFECQVRFPTPKFYAYYTMIQRETIKKITQIDKSSFAIAIEDIGKIPSKDEHGWDWNLRTEYEFNTTKEISLIKSKKLGLKIEFDELIGNLRDVIDYTKSIAISPEIFLNIKIFNFDKIVKSHVDWNTYTIFIDEPVESMKTIILVYMDNLYFNETLIKMKDFDKHRLQPTDNNIGPQLKPKTYQVPRS